MATRNLFNSKEYTPGEEMLGIAREGLGFFKSAKDFGDQMEVERSSQRLLNLAQERGGDISSLSFGDVGSIYDMAAMGKLQQANSQNEAHRLQGMQNRFLADNEHYNQVIYPRMSLLQQSFQNGDLDAFGENVEQLNNALGTPYRLKRNADGTGFNMFFRKNGQGFVDTGRVLSNQEVYDMANNLAKGTQFVVSGLNGEKVAVNPHYNLWAERQRLNTQAGNIQSALSPSFMIGPDKKMYRAVFQNRWADYNADSDVILFDANTGQKVGVFGASELGRQGFFVPQMQANLGGVPGMATGMPGMQVAAAGGRGRRGGNTSMGVGFGGAMGGNNAMQNAMTKFFAPDLFHQAKGGRGGRGRGGAGGGEGGVGNVVSAGVNATSPTGWHPLPRGAESQLKALCTVNSEKGPVVDKGQAVVAALLMRQTNLSPQAAARQARILIDSQGLETVLRAAQDGAFGRMGQQRPQAAQGQTPAKPSPQDPNGFERTPPAPNVTQSRITKAMGGQGQQPVQQTSQEEGPFSRAFRESGERKRQPGTPDFLDVIGVRPLVEGFGNMVSSPNANEGIGINDADVAEGGGGYQPVTVAGDPSQIQGLVQQGTIDLASRPVVKNQDGTISTVRSMSVGMEINGKPVQVLIPTVSPDGKILSPQQAIALFQQTGQHLGMFDSVQAANRYAQNLHLQQEQMYR